MSKQDYDVILTWNICRAKFASVAEISNEIKRIDPDLVVLQECDRGLPRSGFENQPGMFRDLLGFNEYFVQTLKINSGAYGFLVLSKNKLRTAPDSVVLPLGLGETEPRKAVFFETSSGLNVCATHLSRNGMLAKNQLSHIFSLLPSKTSVLMGDLNHFPIPVKGWRLVSESIGATYPVAKPDESIDHIMVKEDAVAVDEVVRLNLTLSDHYPVEANLRGIKIG